VETTPQTGFWVLASPQMFAEMFSGEKIIDRNFNKIICL